MKVIVVGQNKNFMLVAIQIVLPDFKGLNNY